MIGSSCLEYVKDRGSERTELRKGTQDSGHLLCLSAHCRLLVCDSVSWIKSGPRRLVSDFSQLEESHTEILTVFGPKPEQIIATIIIKRR